METTETADLTEAREALQFAQFPLLERDESGEEFTVVTNRELYGREGLLPIAFFEPRAYDLSVNARRSTEDAARKWYGDIHTMAVLETTFGPYANRAISHVLIEAMFMAAEQHRAQTAVTAARMLIRGEEDPSLTLAVWDDGTQYVSPEHMQRTFSEDAFGTLNGERKFPADDNKSVGPTLIAKATLAVLRGELNVYSGDNQMTITKEDGTYDFRFAKTAPIVGNLLVAKMRSSIDQN